MVFDGDWPDGFGSWLYVFLRDLWVSCRGNYIDSLQHSQLEGKQENAHHPIELEVKGSIIQFYFFCREMRELTRCLLGGIKMRGCG